MAVCAHSVDRFESEVGPAFEPHASRALVSAALGGLLLLGLPGCTSNDAGNAERGEAVGNADGATCVIPSGDIDPDASVTSSTHDPSLTLDGFTDLCNTRGGVVELICHCGGANTCKGFSYDTGSQTLIEHTCRGQNTCAGYSCVIT